MISTRYSDWYITTVLLVIEFFNLSGTLRSRWGWLIGACVSCELMILGGHVSTVWKESGIPFLRTYWTSVLFGLVFVVCYLFGTVVDVVNDGNEWSHVFFVLWALYPMAFWSKNYKHLSYNVLDLLTKGVFGIVLGISTFLQGPPSSPFRL